MHTLSVILGRTQVYLSRLYLPCTTFVKRLKCNASNKNPPELKTGLIQKSYRKLFGKYLYITNTVASSALMSLGDMIQQEFEKVEEKKEFLMGLDWQRNLNMAEVGAVQGYFSHYFYLVLDSYWPGTKMYTILKKLLVDQGIFAPFCIGIFFLGMAYLDNMDFKTSVKELQDKFMLVYMVDCIVWIPTQFINFYLLPPRFRVLYLSVVSVLYNMFLSFVKHNYAAQ